MSWMQKHRRFMMLFILIFVGFPLALMVPGSGSNSGPLQGEDTPVATVDGVPITAAAFLQEYNRYRELRSQQGVPVDAVEMLSDGTVDDILENLIKRALIANGAEENAVVPEEEYLAKRLQDDPFFQNEQGEFVPALYNQWVEGQSVNGMNWDAFYESYAVGVSQNMFTELILASPRVSEKEMHEAFVRSRRKMKVKYITVTPEVNLDDETLQAHYEENKAGYMTPRERQVQYVAFSVKPPIPEAAGIAVERARAGEAFTDLVEQYSVGVDKADGGDMGWIPVTETPTEQQEAIFALKEGETSDPVRTFNEVHVYQVVEERINEDDDSMEVHARRIVFRPRLSADQRTEIEAEATAFFDKANEPDADFGTVAADAGLTPATTDLFSDNSTEIRTIATNDLARFRQVFSTVEKDQVAQEVIRGSDNLYVGWVVSELEPRQQLFEEARENVNRDAVNLHKNGPEYAELVNGYVVKIKTQAKSLDDLATLIPELKAEVKETSEFGINDFLFSEGIFWETRTAFALMGFAEPGEVMGPLLDLMRVNNFLELVERVEPDPAIVEPEWEEARDATLEQRLLQIQNARHEDYLQFMSEKAQSGGRVMRYDDVIKALIGLSEESDEPEETISIPLDSVLEEEPEESDNDTDAAEEDAPEGESSADGSEN